ncbi:hypothetical protein HK097_004841 [Rhizophlyctis rosea]|uniref:Protein kinase domain-containing protein n=1 Tax=Rhizophlyctis rosea TaxID=64517 RepID=A0AAD5SFW0_9FUNG|nr:hypothetical protein HK097_004841 [Rhizophlyctis rosea]
MSANSLWVQLAEGDQVVSELLGEPEEVDLVEGITNVSKLCQHIRTHVAFKDIFHKNQLAPALFRVFLGNPTGSAAITPLRRWENIPPATGDNPLYVLIPKVESAGKSLETLELIRLREQLLFEQNTITHAESLGETILNTAIKNLSFFADFANVEQTSLKEILDLAPAEFNHNILADVLEKKKKHKGSGGAVGTVGVGAGRESCQTSVQNNLVILFKHIAALKEIEFQVKDTSVIDFLKDPVAKVDFSLLDGSASLWNHLVSVVEVKALLSELTSYHAVVGQVWDRFTNLRRQQGGEQQRPLCIGAVIGADAFELIASTPDGPRRSGKLDLRFEANNAGFAHLVGFLRAPKAALGYVDPRPIVVSQIHDRAFALQTVLRRASNARGTIVASGTYKGEAVVLKMGPRQTLAKELDIFRRLMTLNIPTVPRLIHTMDPITLPKWTLTSSDRSTMIMTPVGEQLEAKEHGTRLCIAVMKDIAQTLVHLANNGILHRDVSFGNILTYNKRGSLIDFHVSTFVESPVTQPLTFTKLFAAVEVHTASLHNTPLKPLSRHDMESWFYTLLHIATDAHLGWRHHHSNRDVRNSKLALLGQCWNEQRVAVLPEFRGIVEDLHSRLFDGGGAFKAGGEWDMVLEVLNEYLE